MKVDQNGRLDDDLRHVSQAPPHLPLLGPKRALQHLAQVALGDGLTANAVAEHRRAPGPLAPPPKLVWAARLIYFLLGVAAGLLLSEVLGTILQ